METELDELLRRHGHRVTPPRRLVWSVLQNATGHMTAEEIAARVEQLEEGVNLSSIYRSLALFAELDVVRESSFDTDGPGHWELSHPDDHFHLMCRRCGAVEHHAGDQVEEIRNHLKSGHGFVAEQIDLVVSGLCARCVRDAETTGQD